MPSLKSMIYTAFLPARTWHWLLMAHVKFASLCPVSWVHAWIARRAAAPTSISIKLFMLFQLTASMQQRAGSAAPATGTAEGSAWTSRAVIVGACQAAAVKDTPGP